MIRTVSLYRGSVIEWTENIARKHQRVSRSKNNHQFASLLVIHLLETSLQIIITRGSGEPVSTHLT